MSKRNSLFLEIPSNADGLTELQRGLIIQRLSRNGFSNMLRQKDGKEILETGDTYIEAKDFKRILMLGGQSITLEKDKAPILTGEISSENTFDGITTFHFPDGAWIELDPDGFLYLSRNGKSQDAYANLPNSIQSVGEKFGVDLLTVVRHFWRMANRAVHPMPIFEAGGYDNEKYDWSFSCETSEDLIEHLRCFDFPKLSAFGCDVLSEVMVHFEEFGKFPDPLPVRLPLHLISGSAFNQEGDVSSIPPHNIAEIIDAMLAMIDAPTLTLEELLQLIKGPDFAIGGSIPSVTTLRAGYLSGLGKFWQRCNAEFGINGPRKTIKLHPFVSFEEVCKIVSEYAGAGLSGIVDLLEVENSPEEIILVVARDASLDLVLAKWIYRQGTGFRRLLRIDTTVFVGDSPKRLSLVQLISDFIENRISYLMDFRRLSRKDACEFMKNDLWQLRKKYAIPRHTEVRMEVGRD